MPPRRSGLLGQGLRNASLDDTSTEHRVFSASDEFIRYLAALLGCILPEASRQTYFVPPAVESARYSNFLGARGHY